MKRRWLEITSTETDSKTRLGGALLAAAMATGVGISAAIGAAPTANATCASFFGVGNSSECSSGFGSIAIAIGANAIARADGLFGLAIAAGQDSFSVATSSSVFTLASAMGTSAHAELNGILQVGISVGTQSRAATGAGTIPVQFGNLAVSIGNHLNYFATGAMAAGVGSVAVNIADGNGFATAFGVLNTAVNVFGGSEVGVYGGALSLAFNAFGAGNAAIAGPFLSAAVSIGMTNAEILQPTAGINVNNALKIPSAATINPAAKQINRKSQAPKSTQSKAAKGSKKGTGHSARG